MEGMVFPRLEAGELTRPKMVVQGTGYKFQMSLELIALACLETTVASVQTFILLLLSTVELAAAAITARKNGMHRLPWTVGNESKGTTLNALLNLFLEEWRSEKPKGGFESCTDEIPEAVAIQSLLSENIRLSDVRPFLLALMTKETLSSCSASLLAEEQNLETCQLGGADDCLPGPATDVILNSKKIAGWLLATKNKDDDEDEDEDDDEYEDEDEDAGDDDAGPEVEGEDGDDDDDDGEYDHADPDSDGEDGDDGDEDDDDDDDDDGEGGDDDDDDEDNDDEEESPEPPKKKKK